MKSLLTWRRPLSSSANAAFVSSLDLLGVQPDALVGGHGVHQLVEDRRDGENLLFANAKEVVVVTAADDDGAGGVVEVGRFIDHDRRIARPGNDGPLGASQGRPTDGGSAGDVQSIRNIAVVEISLERIPASAIR